MAKPDLDALTPISRSTADRIFPGSLRRCLPGGVLLFSFCIFGSPIGQAQEQQTSGQQQDQAQQTQAPDQDVAKAAREERARKQAKQQKPRHVYTAEDLKREQILTPEDRAVYEAKRKQQPSPGTQPSQDALDAQDLPPDAPLGDIARSLQRQKELMQLRRSNEFHLTLPEAPVFAAPKPSAEPLRSPLVIIEPLRPTVVGPFHPPVKRSPFERPRILPPALVAPRASSPAFVAPSTPEKPRAFVATTPSTPRVSPKHQTLAPAPEMPHTAVPAPIVPQVSPSTPKAPRTLVPSKPAHPAAKTPGTVLSAPELPHAAAPAAIAPQASPSAPKAPRNLVPTKPTRPSVRMPGAALSVPEMPHAAAPAPIAPQVAPSAPKAPRYFVPAEQTHPALKAPRTVVPQPPIYGVAPATPAVPAAPPAAPSNASIENRGRVIMVLPGDSLWKIAEQHLGNGLRWQELLAVNPGISDPSRILAGSQLVLPTPVPAQKAAKYTVQKGDTLWAIAQSHLGRATAWSCVAKANPQIADANLIREGQVLVLPVACAR